MEKDVLRHLHINEKGVAIATAMSVVLILALLGAGLLLLSMREMNISLKSESSNQAFHVAEAGVEYATNKILNGEILSDYPDTTVTFGAGEFVVSIDREVDYDTPQVTYTITSTGIVEDAQATQTGWLPSLINEVIPVAFAADNQKTLQVEMKQTKPFTEYVFFMDEKQDADNYDFISYYQKMNYHYDVVTGSVHANGHDYGDLTQNYDLSIYSWNTNYPVFNGKVTYVEGINIYKKNGTGPDFDSSFSSNPEQISKVDFSAAEVTNDFDYFKNEAGEAWKFSGDTTIILNGGNVEINGINKGAIPQNGVIYIYNGDASVSGTLDGRLTIVSAGGGTSEGNIKIVNNITYANENIEPSASASVDMLGLIAKKDIYVPNTVQDGVKVDAVMIAREGSIWYENWGTRSQKYDYTDHFVVNGSLIQHTDYDQATGNKRRMGHVNTVGSPYGFLKRYNYDERLHYLEPPYFFKPDRSLYKITWK